MENWKEISGYGGYYEISDQGNVKSLYDSPKFDSGHIMTPNIGKFGYAYVNLYKRGVATTKKIHRLVAEAFVPNPNNLPQVNHKDGNKQNNVDSNLEWATARQNTQHAIATGLRSGERIRGEKNGYAKLTASNVKEIFRLRAEGKTQQSLADQFGVSRGHISVLLSGRVCWQHLL